MTSLVLVYGPDLSFDALTELLLQIWTNALGIWAGSLGRQDEANMTPARCCHRRDGGLGPAALIPHSGRLCGARGRVIAHNDHAAQRAGPRHPLRVAFDDNRAPPTMGWTQLECISDTP
jgi:hypothetical protein